MRKVIETDEAPAAVGAYSQGTTNGSLVFTAGQIPLTPAGDLVEGSIGSQTRQTLDNVSAVLESADASLENALKVTIYLDDIEQFEAMDGVYADYFDGDPPARSAFEVGALPMGVGIEIEAIAPAPDDEPSAN